MSEWQPIETIPTKKVVLVWNETFQRSQMVMFDGTDFFATSGLITIRDNMHRLVGNFKKWHPLPRLEDGDEKPDNKQDDLTVYFNDGKLEEFCGPVSHIHFINDYSDQASIILKDSNGDQRAFAISADMSNGEPFISVTEVVMTPSQRATND